MAAQRSRCGHYILQLWFLLLLSFFYGRPIGQAIIFLSSGAFFFLLLFLAYSQRWQIGYLSYFHARCGLSANLECRSEMCCRRLAENTRRKNRQKFRHLYTIATSLSGCIFTTKTHIDNRKKLLNNNISATCSYNAINFGPLAVETGSVV